MATRPPQRRAKDFKPGRVTGWPPNTSAETIRSLANAVTYGADGKHKDYPAPNGEWDNRFRFEGTKCPRVPVARWPDLTAALSQALRDGVIQWDERCITYPARAWVRLDDRLCEARLTNPAAGSYHGFPLDYEEHYPRDPEGRLQAAPKVCL